MKLLRLSPIPPANSQFPIPRVERNISYPVPLVVLPNLGDPPTGDGGRKFACRDCREVSQWRLHRGPSHRVCIIDGRVNYGLYSIQQHQILTLPACNYALITSERLLLA